MSSSSTTLRLPVTPDGLLRVCHRCQHYTRRGILCGVTRGSVLEQIENGKPFCPIGCHGSMAAWRVLLNRIALRMRRAIAPLRRWRHYARGAVNLAIAVTRTCRAPENTRLQRELKCLPCEHRRRWWRLYLCSKCGCSLSAKISLASQSCPVGQWSAVKVKRCLRVRHIPLLGRLLQPRCCGGKRRG